MVDNTNTTNELDEIDKFIKHLNDSMEQSLKDFEEKIKILARIEDLENLRDQGFFYFGHIPALHDYFVITINKEIQRRLTEK
ncbi:MAG: hypothetical protein CVU48_07975 [Candidatus Cloacimonetes bacterium HGW-Cloacimonetes-1]|jgi:hypothetical protein|nr:MAG: hypothetical protein CVU48_07975 [Candidatus Cloacimonetes bacterium HGW-Cloacimonetes-1]